jgi:hypothetical protein
MVPKQTGPSLFDTDPSLMVAVAPTPTELMAAGAAANAQAERIAASGDRRSAFIIEKASSSVLTEDMGLSRDVESPERPRSLSRRLIDQQKAINRAGRQLIDEMNQEPVEVRPLNPRDIDPSTGRARLGARVPKSLLVSEVQVPQVEPVADVLASTDFIRGVVAAGKSNRTKQVS